ncbi:hypothetical protein ATANTOWER_004055 [Ataeniobius toweri]|uniref:Uncharacterized protein n=1 Tax=Ataeniobius toweri TaxID=208326 RepID=A0ABU7A578_9TELE|nr:hypothetical protein [Ataeniobius toweri]
MDSKDSSYLKTSSFWSSSLHIGPNKTLFMTEGTSQRDQAGGMSFPHTVPVREGLVDGLPPLPAPVPGPVLEGSEDELPPSLFPVPEEFVEDLSPLPVTVPEGCEDLHGLAEGPSDLHTAPLCSTMGSPDPATGCQIINPYVASLLIAGLLIAGSARDGHRSVLLNSGSAGDGLRAGRLNSGSAGDGLRAGRLNSGSAGDGLRAGRLNSCPPFEAPSAHPGRMFVLFLFCGRLGSALKGRGYVIPACVFVILPGLVLCFLCPCTPSPHLFCVFS